MKQLEIKHHADGTRYARPYLGKNAITGKPMRPYKRFPEAADDDEALDMAQEWVNGIAAAGDYHVSMKLVEVLAAYIDHLRVNNAAYNTCKTYENAVKNYVAPNVGNLSVDALTPALVDALYAVVRARGGKDGKPIAPNTLRKLHWFLRGAYKWFCTSGIATANPMLAVVTPHPDKSQAVAFDESEFALLQRTLVRAIREPAESKEAIFRRNAAFAAHYALWSGERCGEICANSRADAQLMRAMMHIGNTMVEEKGALKRQAKTKTAPSMRNIAIFEGICADIRAHYEWQASYLECDLPDRKLMICVNPDGGFMRPSKVSAAFSDVRDHLGLPIETSFHSLRHTHATWLLLQGVDVVTIKERLGHANIATTLGLYAHVLPGRDQQAVEKFAEAAEQIGGIYG